MSTHAPTNDIEFNEWLALLLSDHSEVESVAYSGDRPERGVRIRFQGGYTTEVAPPAIDPEADILGVCPDCGEPVHFASSTYGYETEIVRHKICPTDIEDVEEEEDEDYEDYEDPELMEWEEYDEDEIEDLEDEEVIINE